ncbi:MAG: alkaline phosphatase family protein [Acidobacteriota bacterium]|nr:alkaline phosphatase family protein [Acidobacteriota bacterium]
MPLTHTLTDHPAERVLIISIDGLRAVNLANFVSSHPQSALAELSRRGVTYTNAHVAWPDTAAGMMAIVSAGSPISTGIFSSEGYDRSLQRDGKGCERGASALNFAAGHVELLKPESGCGTQQAHDLVRVNSVFDLVHAAGGRTAWADANAVYADLLLGPYGKALNDVFVATPPLEGTDRISAAEEQDRECVDAVVQWIGSGPNVPRLSGLSLLGFDAAQQSLPLSQTAAEGAASNVKRSPLEHIDAQLRKFVDALRKAGLFDSTWIIVTAPHGSIGDRANLRVVDAVRVEQVAKTVAGDDIGRVVAGTAAMVWLKHPEKTDNLVKAYRAKMMELGIGAIYFGEKLKLIMNTAEDDSRMPDVILEPLTGVEWSRDRQWPEHLGGFSDDENHVALLISGTQLTRRVDKTPVQTGQIAPLILQILGMDKLDLQALHKEHVPALPGIF